MTENEQHQKRGESVAALTSVQAHELIGWMLSAARDNPEIADEIDTAITVLTRPIGERHK